jgi:hypothetical protein
VAGLAATGIGAYGALKAKGGVIKEKKMAGGGIASGVPPGKLPSMLAKLSDQQLAQKADLKTNDMGTATDAIGEQQYRSNARGFASGGIVAFAKGGDTELTGADYEQMPENMLSNTLLSKVNPTVNYGNPQTPRASEKESAVPSMMDIASQQKDAGATYLEALKSARPDKNQQLYSMLANFGANLAGGTSSNALTNLGTAAKATAPEIGQLNKENRLAKLEEAKAGYEMSKADSGMLMDIAKNASQDRQKELDRLMHLGMSKQQADATIRSAEIHLQGVKASNAAHITAAGIGHSPTERAEAAYLKTYTELVKSRQDRLGVEKLSPEDYAVADREARKAAYAAREFATGKGDGSGAQLPPGFKKDQ